MIGTDKQRLRKASGRGRPALGLLVGLLFALVTSAVGASPSAAGTRVGTSTPESILVVGQQTSITAGHVGVPTVPERQLVSATGVAAEDAGSTELSAVCNCFPAGTEVVTETGEKPIEQVEVGDKVWAQNLNSGKRELRTVTALFSKHTDELMDITVAARLLRLPPSIRSTSLAAAG